MTDSSAPIIITVRGQIKNCITTIANDLYCKFGFSYKKEFWSMPDQGHDKDEMTQISKLDKNNNCVWNYPIDVSFKSTKPFGWPQIFLEIKGHNKFGNDMIVGYGATHIPTTPGFHEIEVPLFVPASASLIQTIMGFFTGISPEFVKSDFVTGGESRDVTRTKSQGKVILSLNVIMEQLNAHELIVSNNM